MGVIVDLIPRLSDESPEDAIARTYAGALSFRIVGDRLPGRPAGRPRGSDLRDRWRAEVLGRLHELLVDLAGGQHDVACTPWADGHLWRIELHDDEITLRARRRVDLRAPAATDAEVLAAFEGLHTIVHWPHDPGAHPGLDPVACVEALDRTA